jgi:enoyl-CoA hydratase/carnithine racemase
MNGLAYGGAAVLASSLDMRIGCEHARFRFLAAAYGRINSTWTLPNQVGWPIAKELLFSARVVEAGEVEIEAFLVQLRSKTQVLWEAASVQGTVWIPLAALEQALQDGADQLVILAREA